MIFDLDGTLINSEPNYREVDSRFFSSRGIVLSDSEWDEIIGMGGAPFIDLLKSRHGVEGETDDLLAEKDALYLEHATGRTVAFPHTVELVRYLFLHGYPLAVGTSSRRHVLERMLEESGLTGYFSASVGSDDVAASKPEPDIFLEAARRIGVAPRSCLVIEDSQYGVRAARNAGMRVVVVPAPGTQGKGLFQDADVLFPGGPAELDVTRVVETFALWPVAGAPATVAGDVVERFRAVVWDFYDGARRSMPWRETDDPYRILVSEFMLQQTQVQRVEPAYHAFLDRFPTVDSLAKASLQEVVSLWQGLGYNRRAKNLRDAAVMIVHRFAGRVPADPEDLRSLPGVGPYTAAAVLAFAYGKPVTVLETNIRRLFLHFFHPGDQAVHDRDIEPLIHRTIDETAVRHWYYALMDYGALLGRLFPNANKRSSHYTRQSKFEGSVREVRGRIVRELSRRGVVTIDELERSIGPTDSRLMPAVEGLVRDGMVVLEGSTITLR